MRNYSPFDGTAARQYNNSEIFDSDDMTDPKIPARTKTILEAFEIIVKGVEDSELSDDFFRLYGPLIAHTSRRLKLSRMQTVLLSIFVDKSDDSSIRLPEIASHISCSTTRLLRLMDDIDELVKRRYIRSSNSSRTHTSYRVPKEVLEALRRNKPYVPLRPVIKNTIEFFDRYSELATEADDDELSNAELLGEVKEMLEQIKETHFARQIRRLDFIGDDMLLIFIHMAHLFVENQDDNIGFNDLKDLYDDNKVPSWVKCDFRDRTADLFTYKLIENVGEEGMLDADHFKLTDETKEDYLAELKLTMVGRTTKDLILPDSFPEKKLYFNEDEQGQVDALCSILSGERFAQVQGRLEQAGMRKGFCCLLYGAPGTGKTETVYQLARRTGRKIMRVDVDKVKSCWVGESEKNIKGIFNRYRNLCKSLGEIPILLFNEADAVLGTRMEGAMKAVEKMENSLQNIILQEMESLDGIMIATTNLTSNLDKAFERRFLYKVKYEKPSEESRLKIWRLMLPGLAEDDAALLAKKFDFSGGEIENIARKHTIQAILTGDDSIGLDKVIETCRQERIVNSGFKRVGF